MRISRAGGGSVSTSMGKPGDASVLQEQILDIIEYIPQSERKLTVHQATYVAGDREWPCFCRQQRGDIVLEYVLDAVVGA